MVGKEKEEEDGKVIDVNFNYLEQNYSLSWWYSWA